MDKLVAFLYILLRDEVTPGTIESIMKNHVELIPKPGFTHYSNPYLEGYVRSLADRLMKD